MLPSIILRACGLIRYSCTVQEELIIMTDDDVFDAREERLLNKVRKALASSFPEIRKLEELEDLDLLRLSSINFLEDIVLVKYYAHAPNIYPNIKRDLIERKIADEQNVAHEEIVNRGLESEHVDLRLRYYSIYLQIFLQVYKEKQEN